MKSAELREFQLNYTVTFLDAGREETVLAFTEMVRASDFGWAREYAQRRCVLYEGDSDRVIYSYTVFPGE